MRNLLLGLFFLLCTQNSMAGSHYSNKSLVLPDESVAYENRIMLNGVTAGELEHMILSNFPEDSDIYKRLVVYMNDKRYHDYLLRLFDQFFVYYAALRSEQTIEMSVNSIIRSIEHLGQTKLSESQVNNIKTQLRLVFNPRADKQDNTDQCTSYLHTSIRKKTKIGLH